MAGWSLRGQMGVNQLADLHHLNEPSTTNQDGHVVREAVVHDFFHEMVQPPGAGVPDVHSRAAADRLQPFEDLDAARVVRATPFSGRPLWSGLSLMS